MIRNIFFYTLVTAFIVLSIFAITRYVLQQVASAATANCQDVPPQAFARHGVGVGATAISDGLRSSALLHPLRIVERDHLNRDELFTLHRICLTASPGHASPSFGRTVIFPLLLSVLAPALTPSTDTFFLFPEGTLVVTGFLSDDLPQILPVLAPAIVAQSFPSYTLPDVSHIPFTIEEAAADASTLPVYPLGSYTTGHSAISLRELRGTNAPFLLYLSTAVHEYTHALTDDASHFWQPALEEAMTEHVATIALSRVTSPDIAASYEAYADDTALLTMLMMYVPREDLMTLYFTDKSARSLERLFAVTVSESTARKQLMDDIALYWDIAKDDTAKREDVLASIEKILASYGDTVAVDDMVRDGV